MDEIAKSVENHREITLDNLKQQNIVGVV